jgi:hypothetical protein
MQKSAARPENVCSNLESGRQSTVMSVLGHKTDVGALFDHLVGGGKERRQRYFSSISTSSTALFPLFSMARSSMDITMKS